MASVDIFGYNRQRPGDRIMSSDYAAMHLTSSGAAGGKLGLLQQVSANYTHRVEPRFEAGSSELYWASGQSMGKIDAGRLVGEAGILENVQYTRSQNDIHKGTLAGVDFKMGAVSKNTISMRGCVIEGITVQFGAGDIDVRESLSIKVAMLEKVGQQ